ncbi:ornithine carbamoyltransferase [Staphylococcus ratti]|uniref:Ornithine carbamoyltransferase n=1 Tax=Staphylococcus ratti TaxID=2892440 RepID=A0ABY3PFJ8_9STAP|nr:ornithine carbamoyltransferase [Staphylococcus ratti]
MKMTDLKGISILKETDLTKDTFESLIDFAIQLKAEKKEGVRKRYLEGRNIALLFDKPSMRTRAAFMCAATELGAHAEFLSDDDIKMGQKDTVEDTAKVLSCYFDGIQYRISSQALLDDFAHYATVPVWNGMTDDWHPTQMLADFMTIKENFGRLEGITLTYLGDGRNNMAHSLMVAGAICGLNIRICAPEALQPDEAVFDLAQSYVQQSGGTITVTSNVDEAVHNADVLYTDMWASKGEESEIGERIELLKAFQVNRQLMEKTGKPETIFFHCLPAIHNTDTEFGQMIYEKFGLTALEVTDDVFKSNKCKSFDQSENKLHTIKALMIASIIGEPS